MNIIEKLNKIDVNDLKNIDYQKLLGGLKGRPDIIIIAVAVIGTILACSRIYSNNQNVIRTARAEIINLENKISSIEKYKKSQTELENFVAEIPEPVNEDNLMTLITDFAVKRQVQIESFSPTQKEKAPLHETNGLNLFISATDYKNLWLFINDIETSSYPIRVEKWHASVGSSTDTRQQPQPEGIRIQVQLEIASVNVTKNEKSEKSEETK